MKKLDTNYLSEKQLEQIRQMEKGKPSVAMIVVLLLIISNVCGFSAQYVQNDTVRMILTGICGFSGLGCVIVPLAKADKTGGSFNPEFEKEIEESRTESGYFGKEK